MRCSKCGKENDKSAEFCIYCGARLSDDKSVGQRGKKANQLTTIMGKFKSNKKITYIIAAILAIFLCYRLVYCPLQARRAVAQAGFDGNGFTTRVNGLTKTITINCKDDNEFSLLFSEVSDKGFDERQVNAEQKLHNVEQAMPGRWTVELTQSARRKDGEAPQFSSLMWKYKGNQETYRYQDSANCQYKRKEYLAEQAEQEKQDENNEGIMNGIRGAVNGYLHSGRYYIDDDF